MSKDPRHDLLPVFGAPVDPIQLARRDLQKALPRRFYETVTVGVREDGHALLLDDKPVRTPAKRPLRLPSASLTEALACEWRAQSDVIDPATMPLTRIVNSAIDGVAVTLAATTAEVVKFAETDLVCYRAGSPRALVEAQGLAWDPVLRFAHERLDARFICAEGVMYVEQPMQARAAVATAVEAIAIGDNGALKLAALSVMTTLTGSVLLALAVASDVMSEAAAWTAAHVDEDFQMQRWGTDAEALARREHRWRDMAAAALTYRLS